MISPVFASDKIKVQALEEFSSIQPSENFKVKLIDDGKIKDIFLIKGDILYCSLKRITNPKRAKQDAKIYFKINSYEDSLGIHKIESNLVAKYAKTIISKEEVKKIPPKNIAKKVGGAVGDYFLTGISYGISFVDGLITNNEENRFKSGVKQVYDDSFVSLIEYGDEILIKQDDEFYFVVKEAKKD